MEKNKNAEDALKLHYDLAGKIEVVSRMKIDNKDDLALLYTPGVAEPCKEIHKDYEKSFLLTRRNNLIAVVTDGSAVLGLGNIGPAAAMPVMEGKAILFKEFAGVDAFPICVDSQDVDTIVQTVKLISKSFGGINLEDISAPRCFEVERRLKEECDIPVFHDDQHGTAVVVAAALINALKVTKKKMGDVKIVINGAGAAGISVAKFLNVMNFGDIVICDIDGILDEKNDRLNDDQKDISLKTNKHKIKGTLTDALKDADVFVGVSKGNILTKEMVMLMNFPIIFAMANPTPEIMPDLAKEGGAAVTGTGRSDFCNQINNVLVFPGIFKGALKCRAKAITMDMKIAAAYAIASLVTDAELTTDYVIPSALDRRVAIAVSEAVIKCEEKSKLDGGN